LLIRRRHRIVAQHAAQCFDLRRWPIRQIGERALLELITFAIALAQQDRRRRIAIGNALDVYGELESVGFECVKRKNRITWQQKQPGNRLSDSLSNTCGKNAT